MYGIVKQLVNLLQIPRPVNSKLHFSLLIEAAAVPAAFSSGRYPPGGICRRHFNGKYFPITATVLFFRPQLISQSEKMVCRITQACATSSLWSLREYPDFHLHKKQPAPRFLQRPQPFRPPWANAEKGLGAALYRICLSVIIPQFLFI